MPVHIALLRGINVGGRNMVAMSDLRALFGDLGFSDVTALLQSGNLVFKSDRRATGGLEDLLEKETAARLGVAPDYIVRAAPEWARVIARNPFPKEAKADPSHLLVMFMKTAPTPANAAALQAAIKGPELVRPDGKHLYVAYPTGIGTSKLTGTLIERKLGVRGTARNWNTVLKIAALCA